jgi:serine/threonine protein kinase
MMAPLTSDSVVPEYGSLVGSWRVRERIDKGSHGLVFRAEHADRPEAGSYALKLAREPADARFEREARLLSLLRHPSVPRFEGSGSWVSPRGEAYPYVVMQWVEGLSLYAWAEENELTLRQAVGQLAQLARALDATHRHGVHRDVKGGNVRVTQDGHVVLLDFGSCWYQGASPLTDGAMPPVTAQYRSPQLEFFEHALQLGAGGYYEAQPEDDVYALGITAYRLLAGTYPPRNSASEGDSEGAVRRVAPRGLSHVCPELGALILRMLLEDPQARGSARQIAEELERLREDPRPVLDRPWVEKSSQPATEKTRRPAPLGAVLREWGPRFALVGGVFGGAALSSLLLTSLLSWSPNAGMESESQPQKEKPDGGTALGEESAASVTPFEEVVPLGQGVTGSLPNRPLDRQMRPPCTHRGAVELNGGCWWSITNAPCDPAVTPRLYEHEGRCYTPILIGQRPPTSEEAKP